MRLKDAKLNYKKLYEILSRKSQEDLQKLEIKMK